MQTQVRVEVRKGLHVEKHLLAAGYAEGKYTERVDGGREQRHDTQRISKADASHVKPSLKISLLQLQRKQAGRGK